MAVLLEIARIVVSDPAIELPGPILFLFNGGEESLMQASHGFVHSGHRWVNDIGVFINLEATGSGGPDTLFQHTAGWTAQTYAAAAKYPRGSVFLMVLATMCLAVSSTSHMLSQSQTSVIYRLYHLSLPRLGAQTMLDLSHRPSWILLRLLLHLCCHG